MLAGLTVAGMAFAHDNLDEKFTKMDANADGKVSADEHAAFSEAKFTEIDADGDKRITVTEMTSFFTAKGKTVEPGEATPADKIKKLDKNGDGILTFGENKSGSKAMFKKFDADRDGFLTKDELAKGIEHDSKKSS